MRWKKVDKQAKISRGFIESRYKTYSAKPSATRQERIEDFLARGGKINVLPPHK